MQQFAIDASKVHARLRSISVNLQSSLCAVQNF